MDNGIYVSLSRQSGLLKELSVIANNIANASTTGYKREGVIFSEYITALSGEAIGGEPAHSLSMGRLAGHVSDLAPSGHRLTGSQFDMALQSEGFFLVETQNGPRLTRSGHFLRNNEGTLVNADGFAVLDAGGGQLQIADEITVFSVGEDGSILADGEQIGQIGVVNADPITLVREGHNLWKAEQGYQPVEAPRVMQGFLENSNVSPMIELSRMIEVQRLYDAGQKLLDMEHDRISKTVSTIRQIL